MFCRFGTALVVRLTGRLLERCISNNLYVVYCAKHEDTGIYEVYTMGQLQQKESFVHGRMTDIA